MSVYVDLNHFNQRFNPPPLLCSVYPEFLNHTPANLEENERLLKMLVDFTDFLQVCIIETFSAVVSCYSSTLTFFVCHCYKTCKSSGKQGFVYLHNPVCDKQMAVIISFVCIVCMVSVYAFITDLYVLEI